MPDVAWLLCQCEPVYPPGFSRGGVTHSLGTEWPHNGCVHTEEVKSLHTSVSPDLALDVWRLPSQLLAFSPHGKAKEAGF